MINPWDWLRDWCRADTRRSARLDVDTFGQPQATLVYLQPQATSCYTATASTYDEAILAARKLLPAGVRQ